MKESAQIALSYLRSTGRARRDLATLDGSSTCTCPAGAVPKDGPSAGITMTTALASLLTGRPVRSTVGMTGEVTLQGRVLPIGGVKQKLLAAHRAGLTDVIIPKRNEPDLDDVPESVRRELRRAPGGGRRRGAGAGAGAGVGGGAGRLTACAGDLAKAAFGALNAPNAAFASSEACPDGCG